jgi:hypothetical protein
MHPPLFPAAVTTSSVHSSAGCRNGNFGTYFLPYVLLAAAERTLPRIQAIHDSRDLNLLLHDIFVRVRCPSILANPRVVLLRIVCVDHEKAITVSLGFLLLSQHVFPTRFYRHMIKYRYIPFDWGRKTRYGGSAK